MFGRNRPWGCKHMLLTRSTKNFRLTPLPVLIFKKELNKNQDFKILDSTIQSFTCCFHFCRSHKLQKRNLVAFSCGLRTNKTNRLLRSNQLQLTAILRIDINISLLRRRSFGLVTQSSSPTNVRGGGRLRDEPKERLR